MDPHTLEMSRQRLLALQQQIMQRIFDVETSMLAMDADRDIERTDRVQEEAAEVALTALDEQGRREMEAIQAALDHNAIMFAAAGTQAFYRLDQSMMYRETVWHSQSGKTLYNQRNAARAKQLLAEAGYRGEPLILMASPSFQQFFNAGVPIKAQLEEVGINVDLQSPDWPTMVQRRGRRDQWHMLITSWGSLPDPSIFSQNYHSQSGNWGWFANPEMDRHLDAMNASPDLKDRKAAFDNVQRVFYEQVTSVKLGDYFSLRGWRSNVKNVQKHFLPVFWGVTVE